MFPPIEEAVLQNNPKFAALHKTLTTRLLNPDGSSITSAAAERNATTEALATHHLRISKDQLLRSSLASLDLTAATPPLPADLIELIILLTLRLNHPSLSTSSLALLQTSHPYNTLPSHLPRIGALISAHLHAQALPLARMLHPTTNASYLHRSISKIPSAIKTMTEQVAAQKASLEAARLALVPLTMRVLERYRTATELTIRILEQVKHGQVARGARAQAELLCKEAQVEEMNARVVVGTARGIVYTPEVREALRNYMAHLRDGRGRLRQRQRDAERELERYGVGREGREKEKMMREIARVYGEMGKQIQEVRGDVERLRKA